MGICSGVLQCHFEDGLFNLIKYFSWRAFFYPCKKNQLEPRLNLGRSSLLWNRSEVKLKKHQNESMFLPAQWKQVFGELSWNAIYKPLLKGSECPQWINAASEKWYSLEPVEEVWRNKSRTWTWKSMTACVSVCLSVWETQRLTRNGFFNPIVAVNVTEDIRFRAMMSSEPPYVFYIFTAISYVLWQNLRFLREQPTAFITPIIHLEHT